MKISELFDKKLEKPKKFRSHSENDLIASIKKVLEGSHFNTLGFELKSNDQDLGKGDLKFAYKGKNYKITHLGKIFEGTKLIDRIEPSDDIHTHYSRALFLLTKKFKEQK